MLPEPLFSLSPLLLNSGVLSHVLYCGSKCGFCRFVADFGVGGGDGKKLLY